VVKVKKLILIALAMVFPCLCQASDNAVLLTPGFVVVIVEHCHNDVDCKHVTYTGVSRSTGQSLMLQGYSLVSKCVDGTPCHHQGWAFTHGKTDYTVTDDGRLVVTEGSKTIVEQRGRWVN
jgi:hypothetical protein